LWANSHDSHLNGGGIAARPTRWYSQRNSWTFAEKLLAKASSRKYSDAFRPEAQKSLTFEETVRALKKTAQED
jgi:hypothetical protein